MSSTLANVILYLLNLFKYFENSIIFTSGFVKTTPIIIFFSTCNV